MNRQPVYKLLPSSQLERDLYRAKLIPPREGQPKH